MRITSQKLRQMILVTGEALSPGENPENLALYQPNGTPLDLTKDSTRMLWRGEWANDQTYFRNDVVIDEGDLFILKEATIGVGGISPSEENAPGDEVTVLSPDGVRLAYPLVDGERVFPGPFTDYIWIYFDLISGGKVTVKDLDIVDEYIEGFTSAGVGLGTNFGAPDSLPGFNFGGSWVQVVPPGRYFFRFSPALYPGGITSMRPQVTLSEGAQFVLPLKYWDVLFRASSGPQGEQGEPGPAGEDGDDGAPGETGPAGPPGQSFVEAWKGDWAAGNYVEGDIVRHTDGLYLATDAATATDEPGVSPDPNPWELLIQGV